MTNPNHNDKLSLLEELGVESVGDAVELTDIDAICSEFEASWTREVTMETIGQLGIGLGAANRSPLLLELMLVDQELRWRDWSRGELLRFSENMDLTQSQGTVPEFMDYVVALQTPEFCTQLEVSEFECRCKYADLPSHCAAIETTTLDSLPSAEISISQKGGVSFTERFRGTLRIGRQSDLEPQPFSFAGEPSKLVIAQKGETSVSRNQVHCFFHTDKLLVVRNPSSKRAFAVYSSDSPVSRHVLPPSAEVCLRVPVMIDLELMQLTVGR